MATNEQVFQLATSTPEQAAQNIDKANRLDLDVDIYKEYNSVLDAEVDRIKTPPKTTPTIDEYVNGSPERAALVKDDVNKLSYMERQWKLLGDRVFDRPNASRKAAKLGLQKMFNDGKLDDDQELELMGLQEQLETVNDFGLEGFTEKLPAEIAGAVVDMGRGIKENIGLVGTAVGTGAFIGTGTGLAAGGIGALPGGIAGSLTGLGYGLPAAMAIDGANQMMGSMYNTLGSTTNDKGELVEIPHEDKMYISMGVGVTSGAVTGILGKKLVESIPFLNKFLSPKVVAKYVTGPNATKFVEATKGIGRALKGAMAEGGEEAFQETVQIIAEEFGRTYDGTEGSYLNALWQSKERIAGSFAIGAGAGATVSGTGNVASVGIDKGVEQTRIYIEKRTDPRQVSADKALAFKETLNQIAKVKGEMKLKDLAPAEMAAMERKMLEKAGFDNVYFNKEDLNKIAKSEAQAAKLMTMIDSTGQLAANINAEVQVPIHKFIETQAAFPELVDVAKTDPNSPNAIQAEKYLQKRDEMRQQRQAVMDKMKSKTELTPEDLAVIEGAQKGVEFDASDLDQDSYLQISDAVKRVLGDKVVAGQLEARQNVSEQIQEAAKAEMEGIVDVQVEESTRIEYEIQRDRIKDDPDVALVEKFANWKKTPVKELSTDKKFFKGMSIEDAQASHVKEGYSPLAIDPSLLSKDLKEFAKSKNLKNKKVFVKGGISPEKAATLLGFESPKDMFEHIEMTPTRAELVAQRVQQRAEFTKSKVEASVSLEDTSLIKNYRNKIATAKAELNYLLEQDWSTVKKGIKKITLPSPKVDTIVAKAMSAVKGTTIRNLNAKMWDRGAGRSQRLAVDSILKNHIEDAVTHKENQMTNLAMAAETRKAFAQINQTLKLIKKLKTKDFQDTLNKAGKELYQDPVNQILEAFHFSKTGEAVFKADAYERYVKIMLERGEAPVVIPDAFLNTPTANFKDLTVDQILTIGNTLQNISHLAQFKNKLMTKIEMEETVNNLEAIGETLLSKAEQHPNYDPEKAKRPLSSNMSQSEKNGAYLKSVAAYLERAESLVQRFDNSVTGLLHNLVIKPIKDAEYAKINFMVDLGNEFKKHVEIYGRKDFEALGAKLITVPEFKDIPQFKDGKITKAELMMMLANMGNEGNIKRLENFGVSRDTIKVVLERELDHRDAVFVQNGIWNIFESFKPKIREVHRTTEGIDPDFVEAQPLTFKGREYPGGYFKIVYDNEVSVDNARKDLLGKLEINKIEKFTQKLYSQAMTKQSYLEERTGADGVLNLSMYNIGQAMEEQVHDMFMRVALRDTSRVLANKQTSDAIGGVLGIDGYNNIAQFLTAAADEMSFKYSTAGDNLVYKGLNHVGSGFQTVAIVGKVSSALVQPTSILYAGANMGPKGSMLLAKNFGKLTRNPMEIGAWIDLASEIHPPIKAARENMDRDVANAINQNVLKKHLYTKKSKLANEGLNLVFGARDMANEIGFGILSTIDNMSKVVVSISAYEQAINGQADNVKGGDHNAAIEYARSITRTSLTTGAFTDISPLQRSKVAKAFLFFYNDASNVYNYFLRKADKIRQDIKLARQSLQEGEKVAAFKKLGGGVGTIMGTIALSAIAKMYQDAVRGLPNPFTDKEKDNFESLATYFASQSADEVLGTVPLLRDLEFASGKTWQRKKTVDFPYVRIVNDMGTSYSALKDYIKSFVMYSPNKAFTDEEVKALVRTGGYIFKVPVEFSKTVEDLKNIQVPQIFKGSLFELNDTIEEAKKKTDDEEFLKALENLQEDIGTREPTNVSEFIPTETYEVIKQIESGGKWAAKNPKSTAFGLYQFTEPTWANIMDNAPELGLTEDGRIDSDTSQQEAAMRWLTEKNAEHLMENSIEPTIENLYIAHFLGRYGAVKVLGAANSSKLKTLVGRDVMRSNDFKNSWKVEDFKAWVANKIDNARQKVDNTP